MTTEHMREAFERMPKDNKLSARYSDDRIDAYLAQPQFAGYTSFVAIIEQLRAERDEARQAALSQQRMSEDEFLLAISEVHSGNAEEARAMYKAINWGISDV